MMEIISSPQNPKIKNIILLQEKSRERKRQGLFVVEGLREILLAVEGGYRLSSVFYYSDLGTFPSKLTEVQDEELQVYNISKAVFDKLAYREGSDGLIALVHVKDHSLQSLRLSDNPFVIVLEGVEKPGNLGAVLRTADAARVDATIICDPLCDIYNPNVVRSSIGCLFTNQLAVASSEEVFEWLKNNKISSYAANLEADKCYHQVNFAEPCAIVMGTEADGLTPFWKAKANKQVLIPMRGKIDSLNVSVATAVLTFEAMRQRDVAASSM